MTGAGGERIPRRVLLSGLAGVAAAAAVGCQVAPRPPATAVTSAPPGTDRASRPTYVGYVPYWDQPAGLASVRAHPDVFDQVSLVWYSLDAGARVVKADDQYSKVDPGVVAELRARNVAVVPTVTSLRNGDWHPELVRSMLADPARMQAHVTGLRDLAVSQGYDGLDIDYEDLEASDRAAYSDFITRLSAALHAEGKILTSSVYAKTEEPGPNPHNAAQDYAVIGAACDQVRVMTFDYHYDDSDPGPVAPLDWVERSVVWAATQMPARKVWLGAVLLGYDWPDGGTGTGVSYAQAAQLARQNGAQIAHTDPGASPNFSYRANGVDHQVWFEDATSTAGKVALVAKHGLGGAIFWRLGGEDPATWALPGLRGHRDPT